MPELTISRADLVEIATEALAASSGVTDEQKLEMCETAHTTKSVLIGDWLTKDCGCLVGATYRERLRVGADGFDIVEVLGKPMARLGGNFDTRLRAKTNYQKSPKMPVRVIDP